MSPQRIQRRRTRGWRMPEGAVYIGRGSPYGNPFVIQRSLRDRGQWIVYWFKSGPVLSVCHTKLSAQRAATDCFEDWASQDVLNPHLWHEELIRAHSRFKTVMSRGELRGRDLACWCETYTPCHGDPLLRMANGDQPC